MITLLYAASAVEPSVCAVDPDLIPDIAHVVWLPSNLNLPELIRKKPFPRYKKNLREAEILDSLAAIAGTITARYLGELYEDKSLTEPVYISSRYLKQFTDHYPILMGYLLSNKVLEVCRKPVRGSNATSYRFTSAFQNQGLRKYYIKDRRIIRKLANDVCEKASIKRHPELFDFLQDLSINDKWAKKRAQKLTGDDKDRYSIYCMAIESVIGSNPKFKKDDRTGRLYSYITSLKRELRPFLRYDRQKLVGLDLKTSQPYFLASLHKKECWDNFDILGMVAKHSQHLSPEEVLKARTVLWKNTLNSTSNRYIMNSDEPVAMVADMVAPPLLPEDDNFFRTYSDRYVDMVLSGQLYENLAEFLGSTDRDLGKEVTFEILYSPPHFKSKGKKLFLEYFPTVTKFCDTINKGYFKTKARGRKYDEQSSTLALLLQNLEASFILDAVVPDLLEVFPGLPLFTIHDSILIPTGPENEVKLVMEDLGERLLGLRPIISIER